MENISTSVIRLEIPHNYVLVVLTAGCNFVVALSPIKTGAARSGLGSNLRNNTVKIMLYTRTKRICKCMPVYTDYKTRYDYKYSISLIIRQALGLKNLVFMKRWFHYGVQTHTNVHRNAPCACTRAHTWYKLDILACIH